LVMRTEAKTGAIRWNSFISSITIKTWSNFFREELWWDENEFANQMNSINKRKFNDEKESFSIRTKSPMFRSHDQIDRVWSTKGRDRD
jgi:hypothetical protein